MVTTTCLRILRLKHRISLTELAKCSGVSNQLISCLELAYVRGTPHQEQRMAKALETVILQRRIALDELEKDYLDDKGRLLKPLEVEADEL